MKEKKDYANDMPPASSAFGVTSRGTQSDAPDIESGGDIPNISIQWGGKAFDRMEGNIKGKNMMQDLDNDVSVVQNTGKPLYNRK